MTQVEVISGRGHSPTLRLPQRPSHISPSESVTDPSADISIVLQIGIVILSRGPLDLAGKGHPQCQAAIVVQYCVGGSLKEFSRAATASAE